MPDELENIIQIAQENWLIISLVIVGFIALYVWRNYKPKSQVKPVKRSEIERDQFLKRMSFNDTNFKNLWVNNKPKYRIRKFQASTYKDGQNDIRVFELVMKPLKFGLLPIGKEEGYTVRAENLSEHDTKPNDLVLKLGSTFWYRQGVYMDNSFSKNLIAWFVREYSAQTDLENLSSVYYASAQEQSVIDPDRGHMTLSDHLEIEKIKEQKRKLQMGV